MGCVRLVVIGGFSICIADHAPRKLFQPLPTGRLALDAPLWGAAQAGGPLAAKRARASPAEGRAAPRRGRRPPGEAPRREPRPRRTVPEADPLDTRHDRLSPVNAHRRLLAALLWRSVVVWLWLPPLGRPSSSRRLAQSSLCLGLRRREVQLAQNELPSPTDHQRTPSGRRRPGSTNCLVQRGQTQLARRECLECLVSRGHLCLWHATQ